MYKYINTYNNKNLFLSGLFFGLSICVKWIGFMSGIGLCIIFFINIIKKKTINIKLLLKATLFFVIIPLLLYIGIYLAFPKSENMVIKNIPNIVENTKDMYTFHSGKLHKHPFSSKWYTWPISLRPIWYYQGEISKNSYGTIVCLGNIIIWLFGIISVIYTLVMMLVKKDKNALFLVISFMSLLLPYIFISRNMFLYHYFSALPFLMLCIVYVFKDLDNVLKYNIPMYIFIVLFISFFIIYYPVISGIKFDSSYIKNLRLVETWCF